MPARSWNTSIVVRRFLHEWILDLGFSFQAGNGGESALIFAFGPAGWGGLDGKHRGRSQTGWRTQELP